MTNKTTASKPQCRLLYSATKVLGLFVVAMLAVFIVTTHHAYAAAPWAINIPNDIAYGPSGYHTVLNSYDAANTQAKKYALNDWISEWQQPALDGATQATAIPYVVGTPDITLQMNHSVFLYHSLLTNPAIRFPNDGIPNVPAAQDNLENNVQIQSVNPSAGCTTDYPYTGPASGINPCLPSETGGYPAGLVESADYSANMNTRYWASNPTYFYYVPAANAFTTVGYHLVTIELTYSEINTWPNNPQSQQYQCASDGDYVSNAFDWAHCPSTTVPLSLWFNIGGTTHGPAGSLTGDVTTCQIMGNAFDSNDNVVTLEIDVSVNGPMGSGAPVYQYGPNDPYNDKQSTLFDIQHGIPGNHGFDIDPQTDATRLEQYANSGGSFTVYVYAMGVSPGGTLDGTDALLGQAVVQPCSGGGGPPPSHTGSASCIQPPTFVPARLPWDPGEQVSVTVGVDYAMPSGTSDPNAPGDHATYTTYSEGRPPPSIQIQPELADWIWTVTGTPDMAGDISATGTSTIPPDALGKAFDVNWSFMWYVLETIHTWNPATGYSTSTTTIPQSTSCTHPASLTGNPPTQAVEDYPYFRVYGSDISAGGGSTCTASATGGIYGWQKEQVGTLPSDWIGGAGSQFAEAATGVLEGSASAANVGAGAKVAAPTGLSFANTSTDTGNSIYGGCSGGVDGTTSAKIQGYYAPPAGCPNFAAAPILDELSNATSGVYCYTPPAGDPANKGVTLSGNIAAGNHIVLYVDGDVDIGDNITFGGSPWASTTAMPSLWVIASGQIGVEPNTSEIDGVYVAAGGDGIAGNGNINTCNWTPGQADLRYYGVCDKYQLTVNGALIAANNIYLDRTIGTVSDSSANESNTSTTPAEIINFNPDVFLSTPTSLDPNYAAISSLPPVL